MSITPQWEKRTLEIDRVNIPASEYIELLKIKDGIIQYIDSLKKDISRIQSTVDRRIDRRGQNKQSEDSRRYISNAIKAVNSWNNAVETIKRKLKSF
jgi:hypothetical protein